jgi:hypothetical protein
MVICVRKESECDDRLCRFFTRDDAGLVGTHGFLYGSLFVGYLQGYFCEIDVC